MGDGSKESVLIDRLEVLAQQQPALYRFRVAALAALGYAYLLLIVLLLLALVVGAVFMAFEVSALNFLIIKVIWIPFVLAGLVLRSLWVTIPEPDGRELKYDDAPRLFDLVKEIRRTLHGPRVHHLLVSDELNAAIVQIPRLGMFGWLQNYLVVGLPLLQALSPEELRATLAHEFGHLSGKHGRFAGWVYRVRQTWIQILTTVHQQKQYAAFLFEGFLNWYAPYFSAYSFVLARAQEREADRFAVQLVGKDVFARTLVRVEEKERAMQEEFWPGFYEAAKDQPHPPTNVFGQMLARIDQSVDRTQAAKWFTEAITVKTGYDNTHPALADRLVALGFDREELGDVATAEELVSMGEAGNENAAAYYLKKLPDDFVAGHDRLWRERIAKIWRQRYADIQGIRERLAELEKKAATQTLTAEEDWERAVGTAEAEDKESALPFLREVLHKNPEHAGANFALGSMLLEQHDALGVEHLEKAMAAVSMLTLQACELIYEFHSQAGRSEPAEVYRERAAKFHAALERHNEQSGNISAADRFEPHGLNETELRAVQNQLAKVAGLTSAYLVRKVFADAIMPLYVLGVTAGYMWIEGQSEKNSVVLLQSLASGLEFPHPIVFLSLEDSIKPVQDKLCGISGAEIYRRQ